MNELNLRLFARKLIAMSWEGNVDGADVQSAASEFGLIVDDVATEDDCGTDYGFCGEPGDHIFRFSKDLSLESAPTSGDRREHHNESPLLNQ